MSRQVSTTSRATNADIKGGKRIIYFLRHFGEMMLAMMLGMAVLGLAYDQLLNALGYQDPIESFPVLSILVSAFAMSAPMVVWMRYRGHSWYKSLEMAGAMFVPVLPLLVLYEAGTISALALNHLPHAFMCPSMLVVMLLRRDEYTCHHGKTVVSSAQQVEVGEAA